MDSRTPGGEWKRFHPRLTPVGNCPPTSRHGCWRRRRPPFCRDCCGNLGPVQTQTPWGWETCPREAPTGLRHSAQGDSPCLQRLHPRGPGAQARRRGDPDAAARLHQPRWRKLRAPLELGSRLLEGRSLPSVCPSALPSSCSAASLARPPSASTQPLHRLPPSAGPQRLMEAPLHGAPSRFARPGPAPPGERGGEAASCRAPRGGRARRGHSHRGASLLFLVYTSVLGARHGAVQFPRFHVKMKGRPLPSHPSGC